MNAIKKIRQHFSSLFLPVRKAMPFVGGAYRIVLIVTLILSLFWVMSKPVKNWITTIGRINVYDSLIHGGRPDVMASFVNGDWVSSKEQMALLNGVLKVDAKRMNVSAALLAVVALVMSLSVIVFDSVIACGGLLKRIKNYVFLLSQADGNYSGVPLNFEQGVVKAEDGKCDDLIVHHVEKTTTPIAVMSGFSRTHARGVSSGRRQLLDWINRVNHVALFAHVYRTQLKRRLLKVRRIHALGLSPRASLSITSSSVKIAETGGIDYKLALTRMGGKKDLYLRMLPLFLDNLSKVISSLQCTLAARNMLELSRQLHTLKGLSGTMGAIKIAEKASRLEKLLPVAHSFLIIRNNVDDLCKDISNMLPHVELLLSELQNEISLAAKNVVVSPAVIVSKESWINRLEQQLSENDMAALSTMKILLHQFGGQDHKYLEELNQAVNDLDFKKALIFCKKIAEAYGFEGGVQND